VHLQFLDFNLLNTKLNPICPLLALFRSHHILQVTKFRVKGGQVRNGNSSSDSCDGMAGMLLQTFSNFHYFMSVLILWKGTMCITNLVRIVPALM